MHDDSRQNLANSVYEQLRSELFDFRLLPGDRFSEIEVAERTGTSRTPVRQALYRLHREGFLEVRPRSGWEVKPLNFEQLDALYELRILLEQAAVKRLADLTPERLNAALVPLEERWMVPPRKRCAIVTVIAAWDEDFHCSLVAAARNAEFVRVHWDVTERIRIVRRLDFTKPARVRATYEEHSSILRALRQNSFEDAANQLRVHIALSQVAARKITLHRLQGARQSLGTEGSDKSRRRDSSTHNGSSSPGGIPSS
jgi:DNA-binding GntR family transcriptional regulator